MERETDAFAGLARQVAALGGERCWAAVVLDTDGSAHLALGTKVRRAEPLPGRALPDELRRYSAQLGLYPSCPWRLESADAVMCSGYDAAFAGGRAQRGLARLEGAVVTAAAVAAPAADLRVEFDNGLIFRVFCDRADPDAVHTNWSFLTPGGHWWIGGGGRVKFEPANDRRPILRVV